MTFSLLWAKLRRELRWMVCGFDYRQCPQFQADADWTKRYHIHPRLDDRDEAALERFAFEHFHAISDARDQVSQRLSEIFNAAGGLAVLLVTGVKGLNIRATPTVLTSFSLFVGAAIIALLARRAAWQLTCPSVRFLVETMPQVDAAHYSRGRWCAVAVHNATISIEAVNRFLAGRLNCATWLVIVGVALTALELAAR